MSTPCQQCRWILSHKGGQSQGCDPTRPNIFILKALGAFYVAFEVRFDGIKSRVFPRIRSGSLALSLLTVGWHLGMIIQQLSHENSILVPSASSCSELNVDNDVLERRRSCRVCTLAFGLSTPPRVSKIDSTALAAAVETNSLNIPLLVAAGPAGDAYCRACGERYCETRHVIPGYQNQIVLTGETQTKLFML